MKKDPPAGPVATTGGLIDSKGKPLILRHVPAGPGRYDELRKSLEGISQKAPTDSRRSMEEGGPLTRRVFLEVPRLSSTA